MTTCAEIPERNASAHFKPECNAARVIAENFTPAVTCVEPEGENICYLERHLRYFKTSCPSYLDYGPPVKNHSG
jgi:hypothetical protein